LTNDPNIITASWGDAGGSWSILVHGGAGDVKSESVPFHVDGCREAARAGARVLREGGSALDAVQRAVEVMEDNPRFNAGTGACLTNVGTLELDAAIMDGVNLRAGAVCAMPPFLHPIAIARGALENSTHVLYAGEGAVEFARALGFSPASVDAMITDAARERLEAVLAQRVAETWAGGTVGAVARDSAGHVAAATSTGGTVGKSPGRVGDTPLLGAGTYADDETGACSNTGSGEAIMRVCLAKVALDALRDGATPEEATRQGIALLARRVSAPAGSILVDRAGRLGLARNTKTMTWAAASAGWASDEIRAGC